MVARPGRVLRPGSLVRVTLCRGQGGTLADSEVRRCPSDTWQVVEMAAPGGFILHQVLPFCAPAGYTPRGYRGGTKGFHTEGALTHVFCLVGSAVPVLPTLPCGKAKKKDFGTLTETLTQDNPCPTRAKTIAATCSMAALFLPTMDYDDVHIHLQDFGQEAVQLAKNYIKALKGISTFKTHLDFTRKCKEKNIVPRSLQLRQPINTAEGRDIINKAQQRLVTARIHECHTVIRKREVDAFFAKRQLEHQVPHLFSSIDSFAKAIASSDENKHRKMQKKKLFFNQANRKIRNIG
ncbi:hypothetical protein HPB49_025620 [Dermacentor silvarum]|uniref:Uncharacterized protein n=1 Tax=Dermacentor silvarum TaxID=543639 RepID=A0ACB8CIS0_DERSI|nr:hypothetical protein HPB49_025620 [Dermacentor silvarum]